MERERDSLSTTDTITELLENYISETKKKPFLNFQGSLFSSNIKNEKSDPIITLLRKKITETARTNQIIYMDRQLLHDNMLQEITCNYDDSDQKSSYSSQWINYDEFCRIRQNMGPFLKNFVPLTLFSQLYQNHPDGLISKTVFNDYLEKINRYFELRIMLSVYDTLGTGFLTHKQFSTFVIDYIQNSPTVMTFQYENLVECYKLDVLVWFTFLCDPYSTGKMKILDILKSGQIEMFCDTHEKQHHSMSYFAKTSWFQIEESIQHYETFKIMDEKSEQLISFDSFFNIQMKFYTATYIKEAFNRLANHSGRMNYKAFSTFLAAAENISTAQGLIFFFRILDVNGDGYLDAYDIKFFYSEIYERIDSIDPFSAICSEEIISEIFDMVKPKDPSRFTVDELICSLYGRVIVRLLIANDGFYEYECMDNGY